jgi:hypothetical protein
MNTTSEKNDLSLVLKEVARLSEEPDLMLTGDEIKEYDEIKILGEILNEIQSPQLAYYTGT